jgi:hypothetical protein
LVRHNIPGFPGRNEIESLDPKLVYRIFKIANFFINPDRKEEVEEEKEEEVEGEGGGR